MPTLIGSLKQSRKALKEQRLDALKNLQSAEKTGEILHGALLFAKEELLNASTHADEIINHTNAAISAQKESIFHISEQIKNIETIAGSLNYLQKAVDDGLFAAPAQQIEDMLTNSTQKQNNSEQPKISV